MLYYVKGRYGMQTYTIEEIFFHMPKLLAQFQEWEREQVRAELGIHKKGLTAERAAERNKTMLDIACGMTANELKLLYYLRNTDGISAEKALKEIRKVFHAQCTLKNSLCGEETYTDILHK